MESFAKQNKLIVKESTRVMYLFMFVNANQFYLFNINFIFATK
jgi:hypothetical protein